MTAKKNYHLGSLAREDLAKNSQQRLSRRCAHQLSMPSSLPFSLASFLRFCFSSVGASFLNSSKSMRPSSSLSPFETTFPIFLSSSNHSKPSFFRAAFSSSLSNSPLPSSSAYSNSFWSVHWPSLESEVSIKSPMTLPWALMISPRSFFRRSSPITFFAASTIGVKRPSFAFPPMATPRSRPDGLLRVLVTAPPTHAGLRPQESRAATASADSERARSSEREERAIANSALQDSGSVSVDEAWPMR